MVSTDLSTAEKNPWQFTARDLSKINYQSCRNELAPGGLIILTYIGGVVVEPVVGHIAVIGAH